MSLVNILREKNIKVKKIPKWGNVLRKQWEDNFASHMSDDEKKSISMYDNDGFSGYLWHLFSNKKKECLQGQEAKKTFNAEHKNNCYIFYQHTNYVLILENAGGLKAGDLQDEFDVYVVDKDFNWTYVKTHETGWCGPYFSRRDTKK
ncbi:MAG: DUF4275 family protein [Clostridiaceae bacterium]